MKKKLLWLRKTGKRLFDKINNETVKNNLLQAIPFWIASLITGVISVFYASLFSLAESGTAFIISINHYWLFLITPICFLAAWWVVRRYATYARGSGIPQVIAAVELMDTGEESKIKKLLSLRIIIIKIISSLLMVLGGGVVGREGPTIQVAGSVFKKINEWLPAWWPPIPKANMIMAGAGAGLLREWGRKGGKEGIDQLLQLYGKGHNGDYMSKMALCGWAENDLQGAAAWLNTHTENKDWQGCLYSILLGASNKDLNVATTAAIQSTTPDLTWLRNKSAEMLAETAVRQGGLANLKSWFASLPDNAESAWFRNAAMEHVARSLDHASMKQSMEFLESVAAEPWRNDKPYRAVMHKLAEKNPQRALEWAQGLPPSPETNQWPGMETAVRTWLTQDPAGLGRWIDSQGSSAFSSQVKQMQSKLSK